MILTNETNALAMSFRTKRDGSPVFPGVGLTGGRRPGLTIMTSNAVGDNVIGAATGTDPLCRRGRRDDRRVARGVLADGSRADVPADATSVYMSLWQDNLVGLRAERFINWKRVNATRSST